MKTLSLLERIEHLIEQQDARIQLVERQIAQMQAYWRVLGITLGIVVSAAAAVLATRASS